MFPWNSIKIYMSIKFKNEKVDDVITTFLLREPPS